MNNFSEDFIRRMMTQIAIEDGITIKSYNQEDLLIAYPILGFDRENNGKLSVIEFNVVQINVGV